MQHLYKAANNVYVKGLGAGALISTLDMAVIRTKRRAEELGYITVEDRMSMDELIKEDAMPLEPYAQESGISPWLRKLRHRLQ